MTVEKLTWLALLTTFGLTSTPGFGADPSRKPNRIVDQKNPGMTNPLAQEDAYNVDTLERTAESIAENQEKLKTGQMKKEDYDRSLAQATRKVAEIGTKHPQSAPVQTSVARAYIQTGDLDKAITHASQAMALAPNDPFPVTTRGFAYYQAKDFPKAAEDAKRALEIDPKDPVAQAIWMLSKGRSGPSNAAIPEAAARPGRDPVALPANPYALPPAALRPDDDPEIARYKTEQGRAYARQVVATEKAVARKDYLTAFGLANDALTTYADNPRALAARAVAAWNLRDYRTTVSDASLVLKAHPDMYPMLTARAAAYNDMGRHDDALRDAERAVTMAPRNARALLERAIARDGLHEPAEGVLADYKHAAELDPQFTPDYEQVLAKLMPSGSRRGTAQIAGTRDSADSAEAFIGTLMKKDRKFSNFEIAAGLVGLLGLTAAGFLFVRRD